MKNTILIGAVFVGVLLCVVSFGDSRGNTAIGSDAPTVWLRGGGCVFNPDDYRGRYVLLSFWSSTDARSRRAANIYTAWKRRHPSAPVVLAGVNFDANPAVFSGIVRRDGLDPDNHCRVSGDTARAVADVYGLHGGYGSLLIAPDGKIVAHNPTEGQLDKLIVQTL